MVVEAIRVGISFNRNVCAIIFFISKVLLDFYSGYWFIEREEKNERLKDIQRMNLKLIFAKTVKIS